jgi:hypothetical protein
VVAAAVVDAAATVVAVVDSVAQAVTDRLTGWGNDQEPQPKALLLIAQ